MIKKSTKFKILSAIFFLVVLVLLAWFLLTKENIDIIVSVFKHDMTNDQIQERLSDLGIRGYITVSILSLLQVVLTFLPAEPAQVLAGLTFGFFPGLAACVLGVMMGNTLIFMLYKLLGDRLNAYFDKELHLNLNKLSNSKVIVLTILILYILPVIPYGMICFFAATMRMKYPKYIAVTTIGSLPSVIIGVLLGHAALATSWIVSVSIFGVLVIGLIIFFIKKKAVIDWINRIIDEAKEKNSDRFNVKKYKSSKLNLPYVISKIIFFGKVKIKYTSKVENIEKPCVVLCNHGSFIDFAYAGTILKKHSPNFVVARLYFYKRLYRNFLRGYGCFPKSMFCSDLESAKNCLQVIRRGGVLAMMPEARLSTVGRFEDIQSGTYSFLKAAGVTVYSIKMNGDYLAKPKWGDKMRRGSYVEAELDLLFTKDELKELTPEQIGKRVESRLYYDEYKWLDAHPEVEYRSRTLAKGLENILTLCPKCGKKYTIATHGMDVYCEECGMRATLDRRYSFINGEPFSNIADWYDHQTEAYRRNMAEDKDFALVSKVELKHSSKDGKTTLYSAGRGVCTLNREGLTYVGTRDGEEITKHFSQQSIYRLLFGAGEDFEIYEGKEIYYFIPENKKSCVDWYIVSGLLKEPELSGALSAMEV